MAGDDSDELGDEETDESEDSGSDADDDYFDCVVANLRWREFWNESEVDLVSQIHMCILL